MEHPKLPAEFFQPRLILGILMDDVRRLFYDRIVERSQFLPATYPLVDATIGPSFDLVEPQEALKRRQRVPDDHIGLPFRGARHCIRVTPCVKENHWRVTKPKERNNARYWS